MRIILSLLIAIVVASYGLHAEENPNSNPSEHKSPTHQWEFVVYIISGSRSGQTWTGSFEINNRDLVGADDKAIIPENFFLHYAGRIFKASDLDDVPKIRFSNGQPVEVIATGGPKYLRFGLSAGFERGQFGRPSEQFIRNDRPYFGYLDPDTYVDGAGTISFLPLAPTITFIPHQTDQPKDSSNTKPKAKF
jgi:hypothetical protein